MLLFLVLTMTSGFTNSARRIFMVSTAFWFYHAGGLVIPFLFLSGGLFAELSLSQKKVATLEVAGKRRSWVKESWPMGMAILALFLASFPPREWGRAAYSRSICHVFETYILPNGGNIHLAFLQQLLEQRLTL